MHQVFANKTLSQLAGRTWSAPEILTQWLTQEQGCETMQEVRIVKKLTFLVVEPVTKEPLRKVKSAGDLPCSEEWLSNKQAAAPDAGKKMPTKELCPPAFPDPEQPGFEFPAAPMLDQSWIPHALEQVTVWEPYPTTSLAALCASPSSSSSEHGHLCCHGLRICHFSSARCEKMFPGRCSHCHECSIPGNRPSAFERLRRKRKEAMILLDLIASFPGSSAYREGQMKLISTAVAGRKSKDLLLIIDKLQSVLSSLQEWSKVKQVYPSYLFDPTWVVANESALVAQETGRTCHEEMQTCRLSNNSDSVHVDGSCMEADV